MAKKYHPVERKIHPLTIISILVVIIGMITAIIVLQPNANKLFYREYTEAYQVHYIQSQQNENATPPIFKQGALDESNKFSFVTHYHDNWLGLEKGLGSQIKNKGLTIVFLSDIKEIGSFNSIPYVHERLVGSNSHAIGNEIIEPSALYAEGLVKNFIYYRIDSSEVGDLIEKINEQTDSDLSYSRAPVLLAFQNNELIHSINASGSSITPNQARDFYTEVYDIITNE